MIARCAGCAVSQAASAPNFGLSSTQMTGAVDAGRKFTWEALFAAMQLRGRPALATCSSVGSPEENAERLGSVVRSLSSCAGASVSRPHASASASWVFVSPPPPSCSASCCTATSDTCTARGTQTYSLPSSGCRTLLTNAASLAVLPPAHSVQGVGPQSISLLVERHCQVRLTNHSCVRR